MTTPSSAISEYLLDLTGFTVIPGMIGTQVIGIGNAQPLYTSFLIDFIMIFSFPIVDSLFPRFMLKYRFFSTCSTE